MSRSMLAMVQEGSDRTRPMELRNVPLKWPLGPDEVLVRLLAAGVNPADAFFREFGPYVGAEQPFVPGCEGAGVVEAVGSEVDGFRHGNEVCFCSGGIGGLSGSYAEFAVVPASQLVAKPANISMEQAAALPLVLITAWESLVERAGVGANEHVLVHGGAGGTGHIAVQLAALRGARVAATVGSEERAAFVRGLGADRAIVHPVEDFVEAAMEWTGGRGLDAALDNVGTDVMIRTFAAMAPYGRVVTLMGTAGDDHGETAYLKNLAIHNVMMLTPMVRGDRMRLTHQAGIVRTGMRLLSKGLLKLEIDRVYPLGEAEAAHERLAAGGTKGKIVLSIR